MRNPTTVGPPPNGGQGSASSERSPRWGSRGRCCLTGGCAAGRSCRCGLVLLTSAAQT